MTKLKERQNLIEQMSIWVNAEGLSKHAIAVSCADVAEKYLEKQLRLNDSSIQLPNIKETVIFAEEESDRIVKSKFTKYDKESYMFGLMDGVSWIREKMTK